MYTLLGKPKMKLVQLIYTKTNHYKIFHSVLVHLLCFSCIHYNDRSNLVEEIGFVEFISNHVEAGMKLLFLSVVLEMSLVILGGSNHLLLVPEIGCVQSIHGCVTI